MIKLSNLQWALSSGLLIVTFTVGGLIHRQQEKSEAKNQNNSSSSLNPNALDDLRKQLENRDIELKDMQAETELTQRQLHQLQEELEEGYLQRHTLEKELRELKDIRQQLHARDAELKDAQEEAEITLLQLHMVQEELEYYLLENRKLATSQGLGPKQLEQLQQIKQRLIQQLKVSPTKDNPALIQIVRRQQNALRRFQRLHQNHN